MHHKFTIHLVITKVSTSSYLFSSSYHTDVADSWDAAESSDSWGLVQIISQAGWWSWDINVSSGVSTTMSITDGCDSTATGGWPRIATATGNKNIPRYVQSNQCNHILTRVEAQGKKLWINQGKKLSTAPFSQRVFDECSVCFQTKFHISFAKITQPPGIEQLLTKLLSDDHEASFCRPKKNP